MTDLQTLRRFVDGLRLDLDQTDTPLSYKAGALDILDQISNEITRLLGRQPAGQFTLTLEDHRPDGGSLVLVATPVADPPPLLAPRPDYRSSKPGDDSPAL